MIVNFQIGKNGLNENFIDALKKTFKKHELVKITVLKSCCRDREELKEMARMICNELEKEGKSFTFKIVGFTIFIRKWRKLK